jgi:hypothetical protein
MNNLLMLLLLVFPLVTSGQNKTPLRSKTEINLVCDSFMMSFKGGDYEKALKLLKQNSVIDHESIDKLELTITEQMINVAPAYGKPLSFEMALEKTLKQSVAKRFYILKMEKYFLKFAFTLYNNGSGWTITNFNYNDENIEEILN